MKKSLICLALVLGCNFAFAQNNHDPQITDRNYKHSNKAATAVLIGADNHYTTDVVGVNENTNYKSSFKNNRKASDKAAVSSGSPVRTYSGRSTGRNYKKQF